MSFARKYAWMRDNRQIYTYYCTKLYLAYIRYSIPYTLIAVWRNEPTFVFYHMWYHNWTERNVSVGVEYSSVLWRYPLHRTTIETYSYLAGEKKNGHYTKFCVPSWCHIFPLTEEVVRAKTKTVVFWTCFSSSFSRDPMIYLSADNSSSLRRHRTNTKATAS